MSEPTTDPDSPPLSPAQQETLDEYIRQGYNTQATADALGKSRGTIRSYLARIEAKGRMPGVTAGPIPDHYRLQKLTTQRNKHGEVVQDWVRLLPGLDVFEDGVKAVVRACEGKGKARMRRRGLRDNKGDLFEVDLYDPHIGMYARALETGDEDYDTDLAGRRMVRAVEDLCSRVGNPERGVLVFGGDMQHTDNRSNQTERGHNHLQTATNYESLVGYVREACTKCVEIMASTVRELDLVVVPGNHDYHSMIWLQALLDSLYSKQSSIRVLQQHTPRKHLVWGKNLLIWSHGDRIQASKWSQIIPAEFPEQWGSTKHRHLKLGHIHHKKALAPVVVDEQPGLLVEYLEALCPPDNWHSQQGFVGSQRGASAFVYNKEHGMQARFLHTPDPAR